MTDAMPSLRPDRRHAASGLEVWIDGRVAVETLGRTGGHVVAETLGRTKQRIELDLLHRTIAPRAVLALADGVKHFFIPEGVKRRRDLVLPLDDGEVGGVLHDPEVVPQLADHAIDRGSRVRQRQHADELREVGVRGGADEQAARLAALFARAAAQPGPRAPAGAERFPIVLRGFVETPPFPAFATHDEIGQIAGGPAFVEPELSPASCTNPAQSRSSTWPRGQARTKRVGTTGRPSKRPFSSNALRCTKRTARSRTSAEYLVGEFICPVLPKTQRV